MRAIADYSVAVFPFLKTYSACPIGQFIFRSTEDTQGLPEEQARSVREIAEMLYAKDNLRIKSASYAIVPFVNQDYISAELSEALNNVQAVVAYCYAGPRHAFGDLFFTSERASLAIFTPAEVHAALVRPDHHLDAVGDSPPLKPDKRGEVRGYAGIYNFKHPFWVVKGSRLYGPTPHVGLNISQELSSDIQRAAHGRHDYRLLIQTLSASRSSQPAARMLTAVRWFNAANHSSNDESTAVMNLAIAFEALLDLPADDKTDRLIDSIWLLLGRLPRVDLWVKQFYAARSRVVHEGKADRLRFYTPKTSAGSKLGPPYQSLLPYGRKIFQLCLGTLLVGVELAERDGLEETLVTNQERFERMCKILGDSSVAPSKRLENVTETLQAASAYRYVPEDPIPTECLIGAVRGGAKAAVLLDEIPEDMRPSIESFLAATRSDDYFEEFAQLEQLNDDLAKRDYSETSEPLVVFRDIVLLVWQYCWEAYMRSERYTSRSGPNDSMF